ncbi:hypothetical protein I4U23_003055 [Adineta vaga]|nr:hypothetical protein I4U23_003055 [Adineta vaga]
MFLSLFRRPNLVRLQFKRLLSVVDDVNNTKDTGIVKRFSKDKGFGFIKRDSNGTDVFVHFQSILGTGFKTLEEGQRVEFHISDGKKGPEARDVIVKSQIVNTNDQSVKDLKVLTKDRSIGVIRKFVKNRGYGFITRKSDGADIFMHSRWMRPTDLELVHEGMEVDFLEAISDRGIEARNISIIKNTNSIDDKKDQRSTFQTMNEEDKFETGIVNQWNVQSGFGFVRRTSNGKNVFIYARSLQDDLQELEQGQQIQFQIRSTNKGEEAYDIRLIERKQNEFITKK